MNYSWGMKTENLASSLIDALGGTAAVAALTGGSLSKVSNWRKRGTIPARWYIRLSAEAKQRGVCVEPIAFGVLPQAEAGRAA